MTSGDGSFYLGRALDLVTGAELDRRLEYDPDDLTTHGAILGMTGSGKTGLGLILIEEALASGRPALILDPKGDMANLLLNFPDFEPSDFAPWVEAPDAERLVVASETASRWREGLAGSGIAPEQMRALRDGADYVVYTPGSAAGSELNLVGSLARPRGELDAESSRDIAAAVVGGLLSMLGVDADPIASAEHVLLTNLVEHAWARDEDLDFARLIARLLDPPMRKLGVFEVDEFFPPADRRELALRLNGLLASPSFEAWARGAPLDIESLLWSSEGRPRASILYLAHLTEAERQFVVATVLSRFVAWMRGQRGSERLRALIYMDEVFGYLPPVAEPPTKRPLLTLLKQGRAYGIGTVLSTQNPVDLDYKALANTGTWWLGRLQTERDRERVLGGLEAVGGGMPVDTIAEAISDLGARQFVLQNAHDRAGPHRFGTRWAISYLSGPITRGQIEELPNRALVEAPDEPSSAEPAPVLADDETNVAPPVASDREVRFIAAGAPWLAEVGGDGGSTRYRAALAARVHLHFDEARAGVEHDETYEAIVDLAEGAEAEHALAVDFDERDFLDAAPDGATFLLPGVDLSAAATFRSFERDLRDYLTRERSVEIARNPELKLYARVGESAEEFATRCERVADDRADEEAAKLRKRFDGKMDRVREAIARAEDRVEQLRVDTRSRRTHEVVAAAGDLLSTFLGGRSRARTLAGRARSASSRRSVGRRTEERLRTAKDQLLRRHEDLEELEAELEADLADIVEEWDERAAQIESFSIGLERDDVSVDDVVVVWIPTP